MSLTPKQEAFCLAYIETGNASEAYRRAYNAGKMKPETVKKRASELLARGDVAGTIAQLKAPAVEKAQITLETHLKRLADLSEAAEQEGQFSAAINAEIARGKAAGIAVDKAEIEHKGGVALTHRIEFVGGHD